MEYIEPKPIEVDKNAKKKKLIIGISAGVIGVAAIATGMTLLIQNVFLDYDNVSLYNYRYRIEDGVEKEVEITSIVADVPLPSRLRIPNKLNGYPVTKIAESVFENESVLEEVIFPDHLKEIGAHAFKGCDNLKKFNNPSQLSYIGTDAFAETAWLESQEEGVVTVGHFLYTYNGSMDVDSIIVASTESPEYDKHTGDIINLGEYVDVSDGVFKNQTNLVYVEIPDSFKHVNSSLFAGCSSLEKVVIGSGVTSIGASAFDSCESLQSINLPDSITVIGEDAFFNTDLQGELVLPKEIDDIGSGAFAYNRSITKVTIPYKTSGGLDGISSRMFMNCTHLANVVFDEKEFASDTSHIGYIRSNAFKNTALTEFTVPYNVSTVDTGAFEGIKSLEHVTFYNNTNANKLNSRRINEDGSYSWIKSTVSYQGVAVIGDRVFCGEYPEGDAVVTPSVFKAIRLIDDNGNLTADNKISLPLTLKNLGSSTKDAYMFTNTSITNLDLSKDYTVLTEAAKAETEYMNSIGDIEYVAPYLCYKVSSLTSIDFSGNDKIKNIYRSAFEYCDSLINVNLPSSLVSLEAEAFANCTSLAAIDITNLAIKGIGARLFAGCTSLTSFVVPASIVQINDGAFEGATNLDTVTFEADNKLEVLNDNVFRGCTSLANIVLPSRVESLGKSVFEGCVSLTNINFTSLSSLGDSCFKDSGLTSVDLPATFTKFKSIPDNCFSGCAALQKVTIRTDIVISLGVDSLKDTDIMQDGIYVPKSLVEEYKANASWDAYKDLIKAIA